MKRVILTSLLPVLLLSQPGQIMGIENGPPLSSENSFEFYVLIGLGGFLFFGIILTLIKLLRNSTAEKTGEMEVFQVAQKASVASQSKTVPFLPFHIFPSEWFENVDSAKLRDFIEGSRQNHLPDRVERLLWARGPTRPLRSRLRRPIFSAFRSICRPPRSARR